MLIKCPECGKEISDKSTACIHCGYPINEQSIKMEVPNMQIINGISVDMYMILQLKKNKGNVHAIKHLRNLTHLGLAEAKEIVDAIDVKAVSNNISIGNEVRCPICGSTQIQVVPRKWSLTTGILTNKVDRICMNC